MSRKWLSLALVLALALSAGAGLAAQEDSAPALYEKAKQEGSVVIYSATSRIKSVKASFEAAYPGVTVEAYDMKVSEIVEKLQREYEAGIVNADLIVMPDGDGTLLMEFLPEGMLQKYIPSDIGEHIMPAYRDGELFQYLVEFVSVFYNTEAYRQCPVKSWWDLTRPEWSGKVQIANPLNATEFLGLFSMFVKNADALEQDYLDTYGEPLELNGTINAGYEFMKRLVENDLVIASSQGASVTAVGTEGQKDPPLCIAVSSKLRERDNNGLKIALATGLTPVMGMASPSSIMLVSNGAHPNAAKLLERWMLGESGADGQGYHDLIVLGAWSTREDAPVLGDLTLSDLNYYVSDGEFIYNNVLKVRDAWIAYQN